VQTVVLLSSPCFTILTHRLQVSDTARRVNVGAAAGALLAAIVAFFNWFKVQLMAAWEAIMASFNRRSSHDPEKITIKIVDRHGQISRSGSPTNSTSAESDRSAANMAVDVLPQKMQASTGTGVGVASGGRNASGNQGYKGSAKASTSSGAKQQHYLGGRPQRAGEATAAAVGATTAAGPTSSNATEDSVTFNRTSLEMEGMTVGELKKRLGHALADDEVLQQPNAVAEAVPDSESRGEVVAEGEHRFSSSQGSWHWMVVYMQVGLH
jgi:hypothetical protein